MDCIFCKIIRGEIPSKKVFEDEDIFAFDDINPQAPVHTLVIPKKHITDINSLDSSSTIILSSIFLAIKKIAEIKCINESGYRIILNNGKDGGQEVPHLHFHILGGKEIGPMVN